MPRAQVEIRKGEKPFHQPKKKIISRPACQPTTTTQSHDGVFERGEKKFPNSNGGRVTLEKMPGILLFVPKNCLSSGLLAKGIRLIGYDSTEAIDLMRHARPKCRNKAIEHFSRLEHIFLFTKQAQKIFFRLGGKFFRVNFSSLIEAFTAFDSHNWRRLMLNSPMISFSTGGVTVLAGAASVAAGAGSEIRELISSYWNRPDHSEATDKAQAESCERKR